MVLILLLLPATEEPDPKSPEEREFSPSAEPPARPARERGGGQPFPARLTRLPGQRARRRYLARRRQPSPRSVHGCPGKRSGCQLGTARHGLAWPGLPSLSSSPAARPRPAPRVPRSRWCCGRAAARRWPRRCPGRWRRAARRPGEAAVAAAAAGGACRRAWPWLAGSAGAGRRSAGAPAPGARGTRPGSATRRRCGAAGTARCAGAAAPSRRCAAAPRTPPWGRGAAPWAARPPAPHPEPAMAGPPRRLLPRRPQARAPQRPIVVRAAAILKLFFPSRAEFRRWGRGFLGGGEVRVTATDGQRAEPMRGRRSGKRGVASARRVAGDRLKGIVEEGAGRSASGQCGGRRGEVRGD